MESASLDLVVVLVMHKLMLLGFLGLAGEHVTWAVGLVLMPLGHSGGGLEGETCEGVLALYLCGCRCSLHSLSSSPLEGGARWCWF